MQEGPLLTEDVIKETEEFVLRTGRSVFERILTWSTLVFLYTVYLTVLCMCLLQTIYPSYMRCYFALPMELF